MTTYRNKTTGETATLTLAQAIRFFDNRDMRGWDLMEDEGMTDTTQAREALLNYQQADMDGIMALTSRQAIHEVIDAYDALAAEELMARIKKERGQ